MFLFSFKKRSHCQPPKHRYAPRVVVFSQMAKLSLAGNALVAISQEDMASCCGNLLRLDLSDNAIASLSNDSLIGLYVLRLPVLNEIANRCCCQQYRKNSYCGNLLRLDLSDNAIASLSNDSLLGLYVLRLPVLKEIANNAERLHFLICSLPSRLFFNKLRK